MNGRVDNIKWYYSSCLGSFYKSKVYGFGRSFGYGVDGSWLLIFLVLMKYMEFEFLFLCGVCNFKIFVFVK